MDVPPPSKIPSPPIVRSVHECQYHEIMEQTEVSFACLLAATRYIINREIHTGTVDDSSSNPGNSG